MRLKLEGNCENYSRAGATDLLYRHKVCLQDVIECKPVRLTTLDGRVLTVAIDQVMSPNTVKSLPDEGLMCDSTVPVGATASMRSMIAANEGKRGNLLILFDVEFPKALSCEQKMAIERILC